MNAENGDRREPRIGAVERGERQQQRRGAADCAQERGSIGARRECNAPGPGVNFWGVRGRASRAGAGSDVRPLKSDVEDCETERRGASRPSLAPQKTPSLAPAPGARSVHGAIRAVPRNPRLLSLLPFHPRSSAQIRGCRSPFHPRPSAHPRFIALPRPSAARATPTSAVASAASHPVTRDAA